MKMSLSNFQLTLTIVLLEVFYLELGCSFSLLAKLQLTKGGIKSPLEPSFDSNLHNGHYMSQGLSAAKDATNSDNTIEVNSKTGVQALRTIEEDIDDIIDELIVVDQRREGGLRSIDPTLLTERGYLLCKGRLYEKVIQRRLEETESVEETKCLERVDSLLQGYISSERKTRSRMKINYILAGASTGRIEEALELLAESNEIDEHLLAYLSSLIKREQMRTGGMESLLDDNNDFVVDPAKRKKYPGQISGSLDVLVMIEKRLKASLRLKGKEELKLLAQILNIPHEERISKLIASLDKVEKLESFQNYLKEALQHFSENGVKGRESSSKDPDVELSPAAIAVMKDILKDVETIMMKFESNQTNQDIFSTENE